MITVPVTDQYTQKAMRLIKPYEKLILFYLLPEEVAKLGLLHLPRNPLAFIADDTFPYIYWGRHLPKGL